MDAEEFLWNRAVEDLASFDGYFIIGGFSYEDRSRSGVISAKDKLMEGIIYEARTGKPVLGICNGAQVLIESGLVPCIKDLKLGGALAVNKREQDGKILGTGFYSAWVNIKPNPNSTNIFTKNLNSSDVLHLPIAHGEGRFIIPDNVLELMNKNGQLAFQYCDKNGKIDDKISSNFPINPNGSAMNLCAIGNPSGNVMAMMPHPERAIDKPELESKLCSKIFEAMRDYITLNKPNNYDMFVWNELEIDFRNHPKQYKSVGQEILIQSVITDKESITINQTLKNLGVSASVSKLTHWEIVGGDVSQIIKSEELYNPNKENILAMLPVLESKNTTKNVLVRYHDDFVGQEKADTLRHNNIAVTKISKGVLWQIQGDWQSVVDSNILANPFGQDLFFMDEHLDNSKIEMTEANTETKVLNTTQTVQINTLQNRFGRYSVSLIAFAILSLVFNFVQYYGTANGMNPVMSADSGVGFNAIYILAMTTTSLLIMIIGVLFLVFQMMWLHHSYNVYLKTNDTNSSENPNRKTKKTRLPTATWAVFANFIPFVAIWEPFLNLNEMIQNNNNKSSFSLANFDSKVLSLWVISVFTGILSVFYFMDWSVNEVLYGSTFNFKTLVSFILEASSFVVLPLGYFITKQITEQQIIKIKTKN